MTFRRDQTAYLNAKPQVSAMQASYFVQPNRPKMLKMLIGKEESWKVLLTAAENNHATAAHCSAEVPTHRITLTAARAKGSCPV
jgi:hypothetical protein